MDYSIFKQQVIDANLVLEGRLNTIYSRVHLSIFDRDKKVMGIRPHAKSLKVLSADEIVIIDMAGKILEGDKPTRDYLAHLNIYNNFLDVNSVCSSHTPYVTAWAQANRSIPIYGMGHAMQIPCDVPIVPLIDQKQLAGKDYYEVVAEQIVKLYSINEVIVDGMNFGGFMSESVLVKAESALTPLEVPMVLIAGDGAYLWGDTADSTIRRARALEELAQTAFLSEALNHKISRLPQSLVEKHYERKYCNSQYYKKD